MEVSLANKDRRGEIWKVQTGKKVLWLAKTNKGFARGGDIHKGKQYALILEGRVEVKMQYPNQEVIIIYGKNETVVVNAEIPHVFIALEDTVFLEWHEFPLPPFKNKRYYEPYRRLCKRS